jgi:hypothetical protein
MGRMKVKQFMNRKVLCMFAVSITASVILTGLTYWFFYEAAIYDVKVLGMDVYVQNIAGFNVDTDAVHFGIVPPGGAGSREMKVTAGEFPTIVTFEYTGDISRWVYVSRNNIFLDANESTSVLLKVMVPEDAAVPGFREGEVRIIFRRA